jgi:hypothetical protein
MRRTLALAGAAVLAIGVNALPAPAAADPIVSDVFINEVAAELDTSIDGGFIEIKNNTDELVLLDDYLLNACSATGFDTVVEFDASDEIPAHGHFLIGDPTYNPGLSGPTAKPFDVSLTLAQSAGGVQLTNGSTPVDDVKWGTPPQDCSGFDSAGLAPDDDESLTRLPDGTWELDEPTPTNSAG